MARVFITGVGIISSIGNDLAAVEDSLRRSRHGMVRYTPFAGADCPVKVAAPVRDFDTESSDSEDWKMPTGYRFRREVLRSLAPHGLYAACAFQQAVNDARLEPQDISNPDTGLYAASAGSPRSLTDHLNHMRREGPLRCPPLCMVASISGTLQFNLVAQWKILGASTGFASACASSTHALGFAFDEIALGRQRRMFVVGAEDGNSETILPFASMRALSTNGDPDTASRPFDAERDGFVGTGGAAVWSWKAKRNFGGVALSLTARFWGGDRPRMATMSRPPTRRGAAWRRPCADVWLSPDSNPEIWTISTHTPPRLRWATPRSAGR